jgi:hypothetical protein
MARSILMPQDPALRKQIPLYRCCLKYFPQALAALAWHGYVSNEQHNPGTEPHWDRSKSGDELDAALRHMIDGEALPLAWRALANLEKEIEAHGSLEEYLNTIINERTGH